MQYTSRVFNFIIISLTNKLKKMKAKFLAISCGLLALASACNNSSESKAKETDTTNAMTTDTAAQPLWPEPTAEYQLRLSTARLLPGNFWQHSKKQKRQLPPNQKNRATNEVDIYSEEPIPSHEALEQPAPRRLHQPQTQVVHTKEYVYFLPSQNA